MLTAEVDGGRAKSDEEVGSGGLVVMEDDEGGRLGCCLVATGLSA